VIVTDPPAGIVPRSQRKIAPPVHVPGVVDADTNALPAGVESAMVTPVAASGPVIRDDNGPGDVLAELYRIR